MPFTIQIQCRCGVCLPSESEDDQDRSVTLVLLPLKYEIDDSVTVGRRGAMRLMAGHIGKTAVDCRLNS